MSTKSHLKSARDFITRKDYANAKKYSLNVLDFEPENYHALVFLGLANLELGEFDDSERAYRRAADVNPSQLLAWQGLASFYEKRKEWDNYGNTLVHLIDHFDKEQNAVKCAEHVQKLIDLRRKHGTSTHLLAALKYYLPESKIFPLLSTLPTPDLTNPTSSSTFEAQDAIHQGGFRILFEVMVLTEEKEREYCDKEIKSRRKRLGAKGLEQVTKEVELEVMGVSELPDLYEAILNHPNTSDELRVDVEAKLLQHKYRYLVAIPPDKEHLALKQKLSNEVNDIVDSIILLNKHDELGWKIYFEGKDCEDITGYDCDHVRAYIRLFPNSPFAVLLSGYFAYIGESLWAEDDEEAPSTVIDDPLDTILKAYKNLSKTVLGNRIVAEVHLHEEDYQNAIRVSKGGIQLLKQLELDTCKTLQKTLTALQVSLATSLVHFFPPKHHKEASRVIDEIFSLSPINASAWMGRGFILQAAEAWEDSVGAFDRVMALVDGDKDEKSRMRGLRAREESAWCLCQLGRYDEALEGFEIVMEGLGDAEDGDGRINLDRARCLWRIGTCLLATDSSKSEEAYKYFIQSLERDQEFAPAFTSLGIYYLERFSPPDPIRASKCFQKAFELDARETVAAKRLVEGFANDRMWDLVEVVAQRTIDGEGGLNAGLDKSELDASTRYLPSNSWAWKAIGVVKFHDKDYPAAIQAFQVCLRAEPEDQPLWVHLGEAYAKAGRHAAAVKTLNRALHLRPDDWVCKYIIAEVKHQMGLFEESIAVLEKVCQTQPEEAGPLVLMGRTYLDLGLSQLESGFQIRAEESFLASIQVAIDIMGRMKGFRTTAWKMMGDSASHLSGFSTFVMEGPVQAKLGSIQYLPTPDWAEKVVHIVGFPSFRDDMPLKHSNILRVAIHSYLSQLSLSSPGQLSNSVGWYDFAVALQSWTLTAPQSMSTEDINHLKEKIIESFKKALKADPGNDLYWVGLGNSYFATEAKAAQHAYIKALEIDAKNAATWINLGLLYFHHGDTELANEALYRAQVLDPDNTTAWVGQFLIAKTNGDRADATLLLEHAVTLTKTVAEADYEFAFQVFHATAKEHKFYRILDSLLPAFFALNRYCQSRPKDSTALHLLALVCERIGHHGHGAQLVARSISILETMYEETEDLEVETKYIIANCTFGRLKLSLGEFDEAATAFESAQGLLADKNSDDEQLMVLKVQVHLGLGLAKFFQEDLEVGLGFLEEGLQIASDDLPLRSQVVIFLAQILWAIGTDESRETAKSRLLECIASDPENLTAINALVGMGILTADENLVDAALSEILELPMDRKQSLDPQSHVDFLLIQHHLAQSDAKTAISVGQRAVFADPANLEQRNRLATLILREDRNVEGHALLAGTEGSLSFSVATDKINDISALIDALNIQAVALASQATAVSAGENKRGEDTRVILLRDAIRKAQRAILMRPWEIRGWQTLAYVRSGMAYIA